MKKLYGYTLIELIIVTLFLGLMLSAVATTTISMIRLNDRTSQMLKRVDRMEHIKLTLKRMMDEAGAGSTIVFNAGNFGKEFTVTGEDNVDFTISINDQHQLVHERESETRIVATAVDSSLSSFVFRDYNYNVLTASDASTEINYVEFVGGFTPQGGGGRKAFRVMLTPAGYIMKGFVPAASGSSSLPLDINGEWAPSGNRSTNFGKPNNPEYTFTLTENTTVLINLTSSVDTYLFLLRENGSQLTSNDDGGVGYNSRISRSLDAGTYFIVAATYSSGRNGTFNLTAEAN